ncbi:MAG: DUF91 domain-containing protein [Candidatus Eisenbacteria bacterium]|nr:DUF91 domain-containing protein [Candidatus Eisenbacteria bacterium]
MAEDVRLWRIDGENRLQEIVRSPLDLEARIEAWLEQDIAVLDPGLLVIGRQVETDFGGLIDLLCLNAAGDLVVVELKRDRTPREITAQILDYASWASELSPIGSPRSPSDISGAVPWRTPSKIASAHLFPKRSMNVTAS